MSDKLSINLAFGVFGGEAGKKLLQHTFQHLTVFLRRSALDLIHPDFELSQRILLLQSLTMV